MSAFYVSLAGLAFEMGRLCFETVYEKFSER